MPIESMSSKQWYDYLIDILILKQQVEQPDGTSLLEPLKCKSEQLWPSLEWPIIWKRARMPGLSNDSRSFLFKLLHNILPTQERLFRITRTTFSDVCVCCDSGLTDNVWNHSFTACSHTLPAMNWLMSSLSSFDPSTNLDKIIWLQVDTTNETNELAAIWLIAETMSYAWSRRRTRSNISIPSLITDLLTKANHLQNTSHYHNAGAILLDAMKTRPTIASLDP